MVRSPVMRGGIGEPYQPPAVEHREPIQEPAVVGVAYTSPKWTHPEEEED